MKEVPGTSGAGAIMSLSIKIGSNAQVRKGPYSIRFGSDTLDQ